MEVCNLSYLKSVSPNNPKFMTEMIQIFLKNVPVAIESMKASVPSQDWEMLQHHAHKLRSHIDCVGISKKYADMAKQVEENAKQKKDMAGINEMVMQLDAVFEKAYNELKSELSNF